MQQVSLEKMIEMAREFFEAMPDDVLLQTKLEVLIEFFQEESGVWVTSESIFQAVRNAVAVERQYKITTIVKKMETQSAVAQLRQRLSARSLFSKVGF